MEIVVWPLRNGIGADAQWGWSLNKVGTVIGCTYLVGYYENTKDH